MTKKEIVAAIRDIGLALNVSHNTVATDIPDVEPGSTSWRIDHSKEIATLKKLKRHLLSTGICLECGGRNNCPLSQQSSNH